MRMKQTTQIRRGLAVGSAVVLGAAATEGMQTRAQLNAREIIASPKFLVEPSAGDETTPAIQHVSIAVQPEAREWTKSHARRFSELAAKRALTQATEDDQREFAFLQHERRLSSIGSPEDVLAEWRRRRFVGELLTLLRRNVRLLRAEDQKKLRAIGEA
jgi:hypothetical protein